MGDIRIRAYLVSVDRKHRLRTTRWLTKINLPQQIKKYLLAMERALEQRVDKRLVHYATLFGVTNLLVIVLGLAYVYFILPSQAADTIMKTDRVQKTLEQVDKSRQDVGNVQGQVFVVRKILDQQQNLLSSVSAEQTKTALDTLRTIQGSLQQNSQAALVVMGLTTGDISPLGSITAFAGTLNHLPSGWRLCNGEELDKATFPELAGILGNLWGIGSSDSKFKLPDLPGLFLRGVDPRGIHDEVTGRKPNGNNSTVEPGSYEDDALQTHRHAIQPMVNPAAHGATKDGAARREEKVVMDDGNKHEVELPYVTGPIGARTANETRPKNATVYWIIKTGLPHPQSGSTVGTTLPANAH